MKMQGQVNIPLNDKGREQARELHKKLEGIKFDVCYSSPLTRAVETARIALGDKSVPIIKDERLLEHSYGLLEGHIYRHTPWYYLANPAYNYQHHPERYKAPIGGETFGQVYERAQSFIDDVIVRASQDYGAILVTAHGGINCAIIGLIKGIPLEEFWSVKQGNCGYTVMEVENGHVTVTYATPPAALQ
ncbi:MAG: histidine phosphatase family protein [Olsenella sp.]|jgi:probable phosphoglycerate mutase|nr:histidine phosphatase family protein [Olsenella sp.]MCI1289147.1 histidine phosphatase family protein [Olsenella sp.]